LNPGVEYLRNFNTHAIEISHVVWDMKNEKNHDDVEVVGRGYEPQSDLELSFAKILIYKMKKFSLAI
jgi:hypothetical protein